MIALCASIPPSTLDFVEIKSRIDVERCKAVCNVCPAKADCALAGRFMLFGVWGGESRGEVVKQPAGRRPIKHGTPGGAQTHRNRGEKPCPSCLAAASRYNRCRRVKS